MSKEGLLGTRARVTHELKTWPEFFQAMVDGLKTWELRRDDRPGGFQVGDHLLLREWDPEPSKLPGRSLAVGYTGREVLVRVDYIMPEETVMSLCGLGLYIIMSTSLVS